MLRDQPYSIEEANAAAGVGVDNGRGKGGGKVSAADVLSKVSRFGKVLREGHPAADDLSMQDDEKV